MVTKVLSAADIKKLGDDLKGLWSTRDKEIKDSYSVLNLTNELEQEDMESVVSNDPRTGFNLAVHLLSTATIAHKGDIEGLLEEEIANVSYIETYLSKNWNRLNRSYRKAGKQNLNRALSSTVLATGWVAVYAEVNDLGLPCKVWNPIDVYPRYDDEAGLIECVHIYTVDESSANKKIFKLTNKLGTLKGPQIIYDYWFLDDTNVVCNAILVGTFLAKPVTQHPEYLEIPIFVSPVAGLPDTGSINTGNNWQKNFGEPLVGPTNKDVFRNYNKLLSYTQQLIHDTAIPRWLELTNGDEDILKDNEMFKRGAHFRGAPGDSITPLAVNQIPVELRQLTYDYQGMSQRGMFPWSVFGNMQQAMTGYAMSQVASAAMQVLTPYKDAIAGAIEDVDNFWLQTMVQSNVKPATFKKPAKLPDDIYINVEYNIEIPGYLNYRATVARMLDPTFRLNTTTVMDKLFPEIRNAMQEMADVRANTAMNAPEAILADSIIAYKRHAASLRVMKQPDAAKVYESLAKSLEARLNSSAGTQTNTGNTQTIPTSSPSGQVTPSATPQVSGQQVENLNVQ